MDSHIDSKLCEPDSWLQRLIEFIDNLPQNPIYLAHLMKIKDQEENKEEAKNDYLNASYSHGIKTEYSKQKEVFDVFIQKAKKLSQDLTFEKAQHLINLVNLELRRLEVALLSMLRR